MAGYAGITPDRVVATGGADQLLDIIVRVFIDPGDEIITCVPTFELYRFYTQLMGGTAVEVQRDENFNVNISQVKSAITDRTKLIFLCNPNNPTGNIIPKEGILDIAKTGIPTVVDEAYYEFSGKTMLPYIDQYPNLMVTRTFSKWAGIAGIRLGYGLRILNGCKERFLEKYEPILKERSQLYIPAQAMAKEALEGRGPIYADMRSFTPDVIERFRRVIPKFMKIFDNAGIDITKELIELTPGIRMRNPCCTAGARIVNLEACTSVPGMYDAGAACKAPSHGADEGVGGATFRIVLFRAIGPVKMRLSTLKTLISTRLIYTWTRLNHCVNPFMYLSLGRAV